MNSAQYYQQRLGFMLTLKEQVTIFNVCKKFFNIFGSFFVQFLIMITYVLGF